MVDNLVSRGLLSPRKEWEADATAERCPRLSLTTRTGGQGMDGEYFVCPCCDQLVELTDVVPHILSDHPWSGVTLAIRAEANRAAEVAR